ncbi:MAG TPA: hypothetical protein VNV41_12055 [Candidatus Acidoferrales bacterium]|jgi:hypothetical protein|nr:hypothetical protein [Candidatus Acidoferrales bacterium]
MARKLAITISGAVSLGSYEAGVIFEIFDAIAQHNQWAEANNQPNERMEVDVLTGASAGGMSAAVIAQRLLYDGASMAGPTTIRFITHGLRVSTSRGCSHGEVARM